MAILAKKSGLMISGRVIEETDNFVCFHAVDNKRPTYIQKSDKTQKFSTVIFLRMTFSRGLIL